MNNTVTLTELWNNLTIENICNILTMADVISIIGILISILGLIITFRTFYKAKSAAESAKEAASIAKKDENKFFDMLLVHNLERLHALMKTIPNINKLCDKRTICEHIRAEIHDISNSFNEITPTQKMNLNKIKICLEEYKGDEISKENLKKYTYKLSDLISDISHNKE